MIGFASTLVSERCLARLAYRIPDNNNTLFPFESIFYPKSTTNFDFSNGNGEAWLRDDARSGGAIHIDATLLAWFDPVHD